MARYAKSIALSLLNKKRSAVAPLNARLNIYGEIIPQIFLKKLKNSKIPKRSAIISALNKADEMKTKIQNILTSIKGDRIIKDKNERAILLHTITNEISENIEKYMGVSLQSNKIILTADKIRHSMRNNKPQNKKASEQDLLNIFKLANFEKHFYYDSKNKNMLLFFNTYEPTNDVLYLAITPNYMTKEYGVINQIVTISKFKKEDYKSRIKTLIKLK